MNVVPYLTYNGNCKEAFETYARILDGRVVASHPYGDMPGEEQVPSNWADKLMHARLEADGVVLMASDAPPGRFEKPQGISVSLHLEDPARGESIFNALSQGGKVTMPYQETFWAHRFGMLEDRFGIPWMINIEKPV